jgi:hypothetical protein
MLGRWPFIGSPRWCFGTVVTVAQAASRAIGSRRAFRGHSPSQAASYAPFASSENILDKDILWVAGSIGGVKVHGADLIAGQSP